MKSRATLALLFSLVGAAAATACAAGEKSTSDTTPVPAPAAQPAGGPQTPDAGGKVIPVEMVTDDKGNNKYSPNTIEANRGDVIRFTLVQGVHNVHFLPDSNPGAQGLPAASPLLQLPGQMEDVKVTWSPGTYYFQCDPHALLGMVGHLSVK
jgi:plastocyanin